MKLVDVKKLLEDNGYTYIQTIVPSRAEFYRQKGFKPAQDTGAFSLLSIQNPNHQMDIHIIFNDATENPEFSDLEFGNYWYELFDCEEKYIAQELLNEIQRIINGSTHIIFVSTMKNGIRRWCWDGMYVDLPDEEINSMDSFYKAVKKIKAPKSWWQKLLGKTEVYEVFNWKSYKKIVK